MKRMRTGIRYASALFFAFSFLFVSGADAQRDGLRIRRVTTSAARTPEYQTRSGYQPRVRDWLRITVEYDVQADWTDELDFEFYVLLKGRDPRVEPYSLLTGRITYIHIQKDRRMQAIMYVHPSVMARFGAFEAVAVEAKMEGRSVAVDGQGPWQPWQQWVAQLTAKPGLVMRPSQTPFAVLAADDYEMVKPESR